MVEKVINIDQNSRIVKPVRSVFALSTESVSSRRELIAMCSHRRRRRDTTRQLSRVGGVYWALRDVHSAA